MDKILHTMDFLSLCQIQRSNSLITFALKFILWHVKEFVKNIKFQIQATDIMRLVINDAQHVRFL